MVDRIPLEGNTNRLAPTPVRSDLAVKAPPASAELPDIAIAGVSATHQASAETRHTPDVHAALGEVWSNLDTIHRSERRQKELDQIRSRLLGHKDGDNQGEVGANAPGLEADLKVVSGLAEGFISTELADPLVLGQKKEAANAAERVNEADRDRVLARIEQALKNVGKLRSALASDRETAYDRLINLNSSVNDLNLARSRVDDNGFGLRSASDAVDAVMLHMRTAVVAHGKMSPELVRLVLS